MAGARDQSRVSIDEVRESGHLPALKKFVKGLEIVALAFIGAVWSKQAVTRVKNSAHNQGVDPIELIGRFARKG